jgi:CheY-like chemotaxis protein
MPATGRVRRCARCRVVVGAVFTFAPRTAMCAVCSGMRSEWQGGAGAAGESGAERHSAFCFGAHGHLHAQGAHSVACALGPLKYLPALHVARHASSRLPVNAPSPAQMNGERLIKALCDEGKYGRVPVAGACRAPPRPHVHPRRGHVTRRVWRLSVHCRSGFSCSRDVLSRVVRLSLVCARPLKLSPARVASPDAPCPATPAAAVVVWIGVSDHSQRHALILTHLHAVMSSDDSKDAIQRVLDMGAVRYLVKPISREDLNGLRELASAPGAVPRTPSAALGAPSTALSPQVPSHECAAMAPTQVGAPAAVPLLKVVELCTEPKGQVPRSAASTPPLGALQQPFSAFDCSSPPATTADITATVQTAPAAMNHACRAPSLPGSVGRTPSLPHLNFPPSSRSLQLTEPFHPASTSLLTPPGTDPCGLGMPFKLPGVSQSSTSQGITSPLVIRSASAPPVPDSVTPLLQVCSCLAELV